MTPGRTQPQHMEALNRANFVRAQIAEFCRELRGMSNADGRARLAAELKDPNEFIARAPIGRLVMSVRLLGREKARIVLRLAGIAAVDKRVDELTKRQRDIIADALRHPVRIAPTTRMRDLGEAK